MNTPTQALRAARACILQHHRETAYATRKAAAQTLELF